MATPIRIKRSAVPGKRPQVTDLQVGELALNTHDAELVTLRDRFAQTGIATEVVRVGAGVTVTNVLYVTKDGNDNNTGKKLGDAKATIKAVGIAATGDVIRVSAGTYVENNPIVLPEQVSIVGDSLREVSITPQNPGSDLKAPVTGKVKKGGKAAGRRASFCARMRGMKKRLTSAKTARDPDSRINKSLRKWKC